MSFLRHHRAAIAVTAILAALATTVVVVAVSARGYRTRHVDLNDGGIWVTSNADGLYGRLNRPAGALDLALNPPGGAQQTYRLDVRQQGAAVLEWDQGSGKLLPVDVVTGKTLQDQGIPVSEGEQVQLNGGTLAVLDPRTNRVWATRIDPATGISSLTALDPSAKPVLSFGPAAVNSAAPQGAGLAVGADGTIYAATTQGDFAVVRPDGGHFGTPRHGKLGQTLRSVQVSAVGTAMVVYDPSRGAVYLPSDQSASVPADPDAKIQAPSGDGTHVVIATRTQLLSVPLAGGKAVSLFDGGSGTPAAPTWLGNCVHAAWAGRPGVYARSCDGKVATQLPLPHHGALRDPVFRVNRGAILLNDLALGSVYDLATMAQVDDWSKVKPPPVRRRSSKNRNNNTDLAAARDLPPKAVNDVLGARPRRTTTLHVLDNDSDPRGTILSITRISGLDDDAARVAPSPDGESVEITLPGKNPPDVHFSYTVDDGRGLTAQAQVSVEVRGPAQNKEPKLRRGFRQQTFTVSAGGMLELPVLDDWRDFDGDPIVVQSASVSTGTVTTTPDGRLDYLAPATGTNTTIAYTVSDGQGATVKHRIPVTVLGPTSTKTAPPVAEPDVARGQVGKPITIKPLANDLPGADPTNTDAELQLAGTVASPAGVRVDTDLKTGQVTVTASRHGTYFLHYTAAYGNAPFAHAAIRVNVTDPPAAPQPPVAVPDTGVLYGQTATTVDVLANDFDPAGGVLAVQHAAAEHPAQVEVAIVNGHWLRVAALRGVLTPNPQVVHYTLTDGRGEPVTGALSLTQLARPAHDTPLAVDDYVTVRSGDSAMIPVLDNDIDPAGATLSLLDNVPAAAHPGQLVTAAAEDSGGRRTGTAFVSGKDVRYVAPAVTRQSSVTISYVAHNPGGERATGTVHVTITPPPGPHNPDQAPGAQPVSARVISGDTVKIPIPVTGVDPDGDTATVTGIASAPKLGRVVSIGSTSITYQAFPTESGTDRFDYEITDRYGKSSQATISVGVEQVSDPQPPVAVNDTVTAAPGAKVRVDVLGNDIVAAEDTVRIGKLSTTNPDLPPGNKLIHRGGPLQIRAPAHDGATSVVVYSVSDGAADPSTATVTVHSRKGYVPPPVARNVPATPHAHATRVSVDVLAKATDPQSLPLHVAKVFDRRAVVSGASVRVPVLGHAQNIVYEIANSEGAVAAAVIHVPARGAGAPYAKPGKLIKVGRNDSRTVAISDYVSDPAAKPVRLTTADRLSAAPATGLRLTSPDPTHLTLTGTDGYSGPAAITFQVTDGTSLNDPAGQLALITVQVQVGPDTPVLRCPSAAISVVEGGRTRSLDITSLCHVWTADPADAARLRYTASWKRHADGVSISGSGSQVIGVRASGSAVPGDTGLLQIGVADSPATPATLKVVVHKLGRPTLAPIVIDGVTAGHTVTRDVSGFVDSPLSDARKSVVTLRQTAGMHATVGFSGSRISITPGADTHGTMRFRLVASDVADHSRTDRRVSGTVTLHVLNVPDAPGAPQAGRTVLSRTVVLSWPTPADNGAQIDRYQVQWPGGSQICAASPCRIVNLVNGHHYAFTVRAHNAVGYSAPSRALSPPATPDKLPAAVAHLATSNPRNHKITLSWRPVNNGGSAVRKYILHWSGGGSSTVHAPRHSTVISGLNNHNVYTFTVVAVNQRGAGPSQSTKGQSAGAPGKPTNVDVKYADAAGTTTRTVRVSWKSVDPNGPGPATYTVTRSGTVICKQTRSTSCTDNPATGHTYRYSVTAFNAPGHRSDAGSTTFVVAGTPGTVRNITASHTKVDGQLHVTYTAPNPHGQKSTIHCSASPGGSCGSWSGGAAGSSGSHVVSGLPDNTDVTISLWDCNGQYCGSHASAQAAHTDGPPHAPRVSCSRSGTRITWDWNAVSRINGYKIHYKLSGTHSDNKYGKTSWSHTYTKKKNKKTYTLRVTSVDSRGEKSGSDSASCKVPAKKPPPPPNNPPTLTVRMGSHTTTSRCGSGCSFLAATVKNLKGRHGYSIHFRADDGYSRSYTFTTDGSGNFSGQFTGYWGAPDSGGYGTVTGTVKYGGKTLKDSCTGDWQNTGKCR